jgi:predicted Zn-dependent protease
MVFNDYQAERFRVLNGLAADEQPKPGSLVKLIGE